MGPEPPEEEEEQVGHQGGFGLHDINRLPLSKGAGTAGVVDVGGLVVLGLFGHGLLPLEGGPRVRPQIFGGWIWRLLPPRWLGVAGLRFLHCHQGPR